MMNRMKAAWLAFLHPELVEIKDFLTEALMPKEFNKLAKRIVSRAQKGKQVVSLVYVDLDGLKQVNDTWGHKAGDCFLKELARAIFANIRPFDICARKHGEGGDEFILLLPGASLDGAETVARRIQEDFSDFSWGIAQLEGDNDSIELMIERAEQAMYRQKRAKKP